MLVSLRQRLLLGRCSVVASIISHFQVCVRYWVKINLVSRVFPQKMGVEKPWGRGWVKVLPPKHIPIVQLDMTSNNFCKQLQNGLCMW